MKRISQVLLFLIKAHALFLGLIMLVGGGICSVTNIVMLWSIEEPLLLLIALLSTVCGYKLIRFVFPNQPNKMMNLTTFLQTLQQPIDFDDTMAIIAEHYVYQPTEFSNGLGDEQFTSAAGTNEGSCKIFAFAQLHNLTVEQTLYLFGDYYQAVLQNPTGTDHQNIRTFMKHGWAGIQFQGIPLISKQAK